MSLDKYRVLEWNSKLAQSDSVWPNDIISIWLSRLVNQLKSSQFKFTLKKCLGNHAETPFKHACSTWKHPCKCTAICWYLISIWSPSLGRLDFSILNNLLGPQCGVNQRASPPYYSCRKVPLYLTETALNLGLRFGPSALWRRGGCFV